MSIDEGAFEMARREYVTQLPKVRRTLALKKAIEAYEAAKITDQPDEKILAAKIGKLAFDTRLVDYAYTAELWAKTHLMPMLRPYLRAEQMEKISLSKIEDQK